MGYSEEELENTYENLVDTTQVDVSVWNSHTVYFDDEVVEYQGKYYIALCKTSVEVPGRAKAGIWKEIIYSDEQDVSEYGDELYEDLTPTEVIKPTKADVAKKPQKQVEKTPQTKNVTSKKEMPLTKKVQNKPENKPLSTKKTIKEQEEEKRSKAGGSKVIEPKTMTQAAMKKMQVAPNEQSVVNEILKEMEFKKIKGFNTDDHNICKNLILPQSKDTAILEWNSSHLDVISSKGEVTRPLDGNDVAVNLSLTVRLNKTSSTRFYTLWVKALEKVLSNEECVEDVYEKLSFEHIKGKNIKESAVSENLNLLTHGLYDTEIFWASNKRELLDETGHVFKDNLSKNTKVRLYAIIVKTGIEKLKSFDLVLKA